MSRGAGAALDLLASLGGFVMAGVAGAFGLTPYAMFGAYAGVFLSVFILNRQDVAILTRAAPGGRVSRALWVAGATSAFAIGAAWTGHWGIVFLPRLAGVPEVPFYGMCGLSSLIILPRLARAAKKRANRLGDDRD